MDFPCPAPEIHLLYTGQTSTGKTSRWINLQTPFQIILIVLLEVIHESKKMLNMQRAAVTPTTFSTVLTWEKKDFKT